MKTNTILLLAGGGLAVWYFFLRTPTPGGYGQRPRPPTPTQVGSGYQGDKWYDHLIDNGASYITAIGGLFSKSSQSGAGTPYDQQTPGYY